MLTKDVEATAVVAPPAKPDSARQSAPAKSSATKSARIYIDGEFFDQADAKISVFDHGLLYGDGVFEGIRFYNGRVFRMEAHMTRLWESARSICLEIPISRDEMNEAL
jgi:branched-chain amino acid aminotransferase